MSPTLSPNTQAILLLTAPLIAGRGDASPDLLTPGEYKRMARHLRERQRQPADLLAPEADEVLRGCQPVLDESRLKRLLARGFLLSQAIEHWQTRAIWVVSRADAEYPRRLKAHLKNDTPPVLYGCGDAAILDTGGLAVVGSRHVDEALLEFTKDIGRRTAKARRTLVSGGARGIDQAAMHGALEAGGKVAGVLADSLERVALNREQRNLLLEGQLVLISPYDPSAGFNVGHAMQRNKLIYALADAALVVSSDYEKGGTWAGAVEQLEKLRLVPVYVRSNGETGKGLEALRRKGALPWPNPETSEALAEALAVEVSPEKEALGQHELSCSVREEPKQTYEIPPSALPGDDSIGLQLSDSALTPADELFAKVRELLQKITPPKTDAEVATDLQVSRGQAREWLQRLVAEGVLEKLSGPVRYRSVSSQVSLFERRD
jgi:predicted Rossmann fold nucleotide-binding protein DprA/Smf involved in DNA uptake